MWHKLVGMPGALGKSYDGIVSRGMGSGATINLQYVLQVHVLYFSYSGLHYHFSNSHNFSKMSKRQGKYFSNYNINQKTNGNDQI